MRDRIRLMQKEIEKQMKAEMRASENEGKNASLPARGLLARKNTQAQASDAPRTRNQSAQMKVVADYIKQIRANKEEIINAKRN